LELNYDSNRTLTVWGAGTKGKTIAKKLSKSKIPFFWISENPNKKGKCIYGQELYNFEYLKHLENPQSIVTVANEKAKKKIKAYFKQQNMEPMIDYFFFC